MEELDIFEYIEMIKSRIKMVLALALTVTVLTFIVLKLMPSTYEGKVFLVFPQQDKGGMGVLSQLGKNLPSIPDLKTGSAYTSGMYGDILGSRSLSTLVMKDLQLDKVDVTPDDLQDSLSLKPTKAGGLEVACYAKSSWVKSGKLKWMDSDKRIARNATVKEKTAFLAAEMANLYIARLKDFDRDHAFSTGRRHRQFLENEVQKTLRQLNASEDALRKFRENHPVVPSPESMGNVMEQVVKLRQDEIAAEAEMEENQQAVIEARLMADDQSEVIAAAKVVQQNPVVTALKGRLAQAEVRRSQLLEDMTEKHPDVIAATEEITKLQDKITGEVARVTTSETTNANPVKQAIVQNMALLQIKAEGVRARLQSLKSSMANVESDLSSSAKDEMEYVRLLRDAKAQEAVYLSLTAQYSNAKVEEAKEPEGFAVVDDAVPEEKPSSPRVGLFTGVALVVAFVMGCLLAILQEGAAVRKRIRRKKRLEAEAKL